MGEGEKETGNISGGKCTLVKSGVYCMTEIQLWKIL